MKGLILVPCELAANMVGLSFFCHTTIMKFGDKLSSLSSRLLAM